jgi:hypothetical protein
VEGDGHGLVDALEEDGDDDLCPETRVIGVNDITPGAPRTPGHPHVRADRRQSAHFVSYQGDVPYSSLGDLDHSGPIVGLVPYSPLGHGLLTGQIRTADDFADDDWRKTNPRFTGENFRRNLAIVDEVTAIGAEAGATPAQTALAWLLTRGDDIAPIPGTRRVARVEENTAADGVQLTPAQLDRLDNLTPASGARHNDASMASIDR